MDARRWTLALLLTLSSACGAAVERPTAACPVCDDARVALYARAVADGRALDVTVHASAEGLEQARQHVEALVLAASAPTPGVAYDEIAALDALERPFASSALAGREYMAFSPAAVDDSFSYAVLVERLWDALAHLRLTTAQARRAELDRTAREAGGAADTDFAVLLTRADDGTLRGILAFAEPDVADGSPTGRVLLRATRGGAGRVFTPYDGRARIGSEPAYVVPIDASSSAGVLGERLGAFRQYVRELSELRELLATTLETQARLLAALDAIAALDDSAPSADWAP